MTLNNNDLMVREKVFLEKHEGGWLICDEDGYYYSAEELNEIAEGMKAAAENYEEEIECNNISVDLDRSKVWHATTLNYSKNKYPGFVYMLKCDSRYKIGYTKNIERRIKELDCRPYPTRLFALSEPLENALHYEQKLHKALEEHRICGEWYVLSKDRAFEVRDIIDRLGEKEAKCQKSE